MILVDTSIWIDHLRKGVPGLATLLNKQQILMHPFVRGELACGNLHNRAEVLYLLGELPLATVASDDEVLFFIERHRLMGNGIGYVDAHLLAATSLSANASLWTADKRLTELAGGLGIAYDASKIS